MGFDFSSLGDIATLEAKGAEAQQAISELHAAIKNTDFQAGQSRFSAVLDALGKINDLLNFAKGIKSLPQQQVEQGIAATQQLRTDLTSGSITTKDQLQQRAGALVDQFKNELGPFGSMLG